MDSKITFHTVEAAIADLKAGKMIIVVDNENRENEGDFVALADRMTPETVNFMIRHGRGLLCVPIESERAIELQLPPMVARNTDPHGTAFTVSIDHIDTTTGISAHDRALTIRGLVDAASRPDDFRRPGHIFPLIANPGGVLERPGHTEAAVDLAKLCGAYPAGAICEIIKPDGEMARMPDLALLAQEHDLKLITIEALIQYRREREQLVTREVEISLPTDWGQFRVIGYTSAIDGKEHLAFIKGILHPKKPMLVRIHSECLTGDVFHSHRCDCGEQLAASMEQINREGAGVLLYLRQEGRGIGLLNKLKAYALQEQGLDTVEANLQLGFPADLREYETAAHMLRDLGVRKVRLMTNNPDKIKGLERCGLSVNERIPLQLPTNADNAAYMETKKRKLQHMLTLPVKTLHRRVK